MENLEFEIKKIISILCMGRKTPEEIFLTDSLQVDLGLDSLAMIELLIAIEETFEIFITDEDLINQDQWMQTVNSVIEYMMPKLMQREK